MNAYRVSTAAAKDAMRQAEAFERGVRAGSIHRQEVLAGLRGSFVKGEYPSNPYHASNKLHRIFIAGFEKE